MATRRNTASHCHPAPNMLKYPPREVASMLDFSRLEQYRENNRIEAKKALGGLPKSIWETYSAFANTLGGIILLGVIETADKTFDSVDLPDPDGLIREFWHIINDPMKVSVNILAEKDVYAEEVGGDHIVVIKVPRADRAYKPVYVDNDTRNTYRRSGEGDYRCTYEEYQAMVRDAAVRSPDMHLVRSMGLEALNSESVRSFRQRMKLYRPRHMWESLDDTAFLQKIDAIGDDGGLLHPTFAGLLMFGNHQDILCEYPNYAITYREQLDTKGNWEETPWNGNVYEFYYWAYNKLQQNAKKPARQALREVLANCLVNADYHGSGGIPNLYRIWKSEGWPEPVFSESCSLDRVSLTLYMTGHSGAENATAGKQVPLSALSQRQLLIDYLTDHPTSDLFALSKSLGTSLSRTESLIQQLADEGIVVVEAGQGNRLYKLKA